MTQTAPCPEPFFEKWSDTALVFVDRAVRRRAPRRSPLRNQLEPEKNSLSFFAVRALWVRSQSEPINDEEALLARIVFNLVDSEARRILSKKQEVLNDAEAFDRVPPPLSPPTQLTEHAERIRYEQLFELLQRLGVPREDREMLQQLTQGGQDRREVAARLDIKPNAVDQKIRRLKQRLSKSDILDKLLLIPLPVSVFVFIGLDQAEARSALQAPPRIPLHKRIVSRVSTRRRALFLYKEGATIGAKIRSVDDMFAKFLDQKPNPNVNDVMGFSLEHFSPLSDRREEIEKQLIALGAPHGLTHSQTIKCARDLLVWELSAIKTNNSRYCANVRKNNLKFRFQEIEPVILRAEKELPEFQLGRNQYWLSREPDTKVAVARVKYVSSAKPYFSTLDRLRTPTVESVFDTSIPWVYRRGQLFSSEHAK